MRYFVVHQSQRALFHAMNLIQATQTNQHQQLDLADAGIVCAHIVFDLQMCLLVYST